MFESLQRLVAVFVATQLAVLVAPATPAIAQTLQQAPMIFDMRKSLPLEPTEQATHDFYINAGSEAGFRKGMFIMASRLVPVHDPVQNKQQGILTVGVARLKVIHADRQITVARLIEGFTDEQRPTLEFEAIMIGDRIDPESMTMEDPADKKKKEVKKTAPKSAQAAPKDESTEESASFVAIMPTGLAAAAAALQASPALGNESTASSAEAKNASVKSASPDMVRVPVPSGTSTEKL